VGLAHPSRHDADAHLDGHRYTHCGGHRRHALADQRGLAHETRPERAARDAVTRTAAVEIDLVVPGLLPGAGGGRKLLRSGSSELQRYGVFVGIKKQGLYWSPCRIAAAVIISV
jgi:hypothetical protein